MMDELGFEVVQAEGARQALRSIDQSCDYDVLMTDVLKSRMDGWALVENVRDVCPKLPVRYVTGFFADIAQPVERSTVLRKPVQPRELMMALGELHSIVLKP